MCESFVSDPLSDTVMRQAYLDVTIGHCVVSDRNLPRAILIGRKTLSPVKSKSVCSHSNCMVCPTVVGQCLMVDRRLYVICEITAMERPSSPFKTSYSP